MIRSTGEQINKNRNALIVFTREPEAGKTKTRLMPYLSPEQCAELQRCMIKDVRKEMKKTDADIITAYTCGDGSADTGGPVFLRQAMGKNALLIDQRGENIGSRMQNAIDEVLGLGYEKAILIGTDIPEIKANTIESALALLDGCDVVIGPTEDGGYYLIGMKAVHPEAFHVSTYGVSTVFNETVASLENAGIAVEKADTHADIDTADDIAGFLRRMRENARLRRSYTGQFLAERAKISVIVPVYNEAAEISRLIEQLKPYSNECEIMIVDGGSTDSTLDKIYESGGESFCSRIHILKADKGRASQMNAGARMSTGDILFFLHCDSILPKKFTNEIRRVMKSNDWGCFRVSFPSRNFFMITNRIASNIRASCRHLPFGDQGIFIDRGLFFEAGMFPDIPLMEDYEFSMKMRRRKGIKGPGVSPKKLTTSARRYGTGTADILKTEMYMWKLRHMYRRGVSAEILQSLYDDIR